ncbi:hypothetical protein NDU88_004037 [Pleurodeles waltl]|uniref:Uncharacterized protein n=1 Tax=Pleurodeles waltl TaxID=8319 RepID=A0AAV7RGX5_PLEWA|nr:hypothetical protein NDU88_004037 [Pleurodeles waltl]
MLRTLGAKKKADYRIFLTLTLAELLRRVGKLGEMASSSQWKDNPDKKQPSRPRHEGLILAPFELFHLGRLAKSFA